MLRMWHEAHCKTCCRCYLLIGVVTRVRQSCARRRASRVILAVHPCGRERRFAQARRPSRYGTAARFLLVSWGRAAFLSFLTRIWVYYMVNCTIYCEPNESVESMWRRFRKATDRSGVLKDEARHREFVSKSKKRAAKSSRARIRAKKYANCKS